MLPASFKGTAYRLADNWFGMIPVDHFKTRPIRYAEVGTFYGANVLSVLNTYASHPESIVHCIDPWIDYAEYPEYKGQQPSIYETFCENLQASGHESKTVVHRGFSRDELPKLEDGTFDIIYIDGNHEPEYVLEDAVLAFRKLRVGGYMVFDDYGWGGPDLTKRGIDGFLNGYHKRISILGQRNSQVVVRRVS